MENDNQKQGYKTCKKSTQTKVYLKNAKIWNMKQDYDIRCFNTSN